MGIVLGTEPQRKQWGGGGSRGSSGAGGGAEEAVGRWGDGAPPSSSWRSSLSRPTAFAAADSIHLDPEDSGGRVKWHYCIVEVMNDIQTMYISGIPRTSVVPTPYIGYR